MFSEYCDNEHYNNGNYYIKLLQHKRILGINLFCSKMVDLCSSLLISFEVDREGCSLSYLFLSHNHAYHIADTTIVGIQMVNGITTTKTNYKNSP